MSPKWCSQIKELTLLLLCSVQGSCWPQNKVGILTHSSQILSDLIMCLQHYITGTLLLWVGDRLFHGNSRKEFQGSTHGRWWYGKVVYWWWLPWASHIPFPSVPPWEKSNHVFSIAEIKISEQNFCFIVLRSLCGPWALVAARPAWCGSWERERFI